MSEITAHAEIPDLTVFSDTPAIILFDNLASWVSTRIKHHTKSDYNHAGILYRQGMVAEQCWRYRSTPLVNYLDKKHRIKIWQCANWKQSQRDGIYACVTHFLRVKPFYDTIGVLSFLVHAQHFIDIPGFYYCSEAIQEILNSNDINLPDNPSPGDINRWCIAQPDWVSMVYDPNESNWS